jgi:hypothetical protein
VEFVGIAIWDDSRDVLRHMERYNVTYPNILDAVGTSAVQYGVRGVPEKFFLDEDGRISLDELYEYVFDRVREKNPHQTPSRSVDLQGEVYLARSRRRKITPAPVPEDLQRAIRSPNAYTRRGAVAELRFRMENPDLEIAAGARDAYHCRGVAPPLTLGCSS